MASASFRSQVAGVVMVASRVKCKETTQDQEPIMMSFAGSTREREAIRLVREATKSSAPLDSSALFFCNDIVHNVSETAEEDH